MVRVEARKGRAAVVLSSDDEDEVQHAVKIDRPNAQYRSRSGVHVPRTDDSTQSSINRPLSNGGPSQASTASAASTPESTPKKFTRLKPLPPPRSEPPPKKKKAKKQTVAEGKSSKGAKDIFSFFNAATQKQQQRSRFKSPEKLEVEKENEVEDISDGDSDEKTASVQATRLRKPVATVSRKRSWDETQLGSQESGQSTPLPAPKKFLKSSSASRTSSVQAAPAPVAILPADTRPWSEQYAPRTLDELVVHKKKVLDVRQCLERIFKGQGRQRMLILKGPAGSGKTTTISLLANTLDAELVEWRNPGVAEWGGNDYVSISERFDDFLGRSRTFGGLEFDADQTRIRQQTANETTHPPGGRKIVLVEEFPQLTTSSTAALHAFRSSILQYLAAGQPAVSGPSNVSNETALVMVVSEAVFAGGSDSSDNFTAHRLFGAEILHHPSVTVLEFNPVASTFISKALSQTLTKHSRLHGKTSMPSTDVLRHLSDIGDVRNAISTLEYLCLHSPSNTTITSERPDSKSAKPSHSARTRSSTAAPATDSILDILSLRESTLGLFHAIGKIIYNKRIPPSPTSPAPPTPPPHLLYLARPLLPPLSDPLHLLSTSGSDASTLISALHENLAPSTPTLATLAPCLDALSDADALTPSRSATYTSSPSSYGAAAAASESLRQQDLALDAALRGVTLHLPYPVIRAQGAHKLAYPAGLRVWRAQEELLDRLDLVVRRAAAGALDRELVRAGVGGGVPASISQPGRTPGAADDRKATPTPTPLPPRRREMLLERLPYIAKMLAARAASTGGRGAAESLAEEVAGIVRLTGRGGVAVGLEAGAGEDESGDGDGDVSSFAGVRGKGWAAKAKTTGGKASVGWKREREMEQEGELGLRGLVLSDDDIEDEG